ncbi:RecA recombinase [Candidatus Carsonella ruddii CS isolate Thao2000]|uniref:Protein RecA n=1 Tax=Candidatus Carsonella ruddii CS isolate Thao2000 TaxID=1202537 RepID=J7GTC9_CARRU|nr:recombinase A [Candidatus Carsonella ruddii]AFP83784.1 RecA recombinase [Candidatus Carsonella ruddii CS isolate Thao2000]
MNKLNFKKIEFLSTGSINLDYILGIGGLPYGRIIEIFGQESCGKTTIALSIVKEAQKVGDICAYIDSEHCLDLNYVENIGINLKNLLFFQPDNGEKVFEICNKLINTKIIKLIIIDSIASLISKNEFNLENSIGSHARLISKGLKLILPMLRKNKIILILINQVRTKISNFFCKEISTGGNSIKFYSSIRIELKKIGFIKSKNNIIGQEVKITIIKNKLSKPFRNTIIKILFGYGIYKILEIINLSLNLKIIKNINNKYCFLNFCFKNKKKLIKEFSFNKILLKKIEKKIKYLLLNI